MNRAFEIICVGVIVAALGSAAMAVDIVTVPVGNVGNSDDSTGYGAVSYAYNIGKYEVTAGQYCEFLNAVAKTDTYGLYNASMNNNAYGCQITWNSDSGVYDFSGAPSGTAADWENRPVNYVSWYDAVRFSNWLTNGQGSGDTESGSYTITGGGVNSGTVSIPNHAALAAGTTTKWLLTSEDEWYKAAYYTTDLDKDDVHNDPGYYDYPTSSDTAPGYVNDSGNLSGTGTSFMEGVTDPGNYATYDGNDYTEGIGSPYYRTVVGEWENSGSPYGTFDQGGNVWEWNEAIIGSYRGLRGGPFSSSDNNQRASLRGSSYPTYEFDSFGFRVSEVPEPATMAILALGGIGILRRRKQ